MNALADLFESMTEGLRQDRDTINSLDYDDGDTGDNMVSNFETITNTLRQASGRGMTVDQALREASQSLQKQGRGATATAYANGLDQAAQNLKGKTSFGLDDLSGLLGGLLSGAENTQGYGGDSQGGMLSALIPGITGFMQSKNAGRSTIESLLNGYMQSQRGAYGTSGAQSNFGRFGQSDNRGRIDPGAAGASSLLGGLFNSLLSGGLRSGRGEPHPTSGWDDLLGGGLEQLFGGGGGGGGGGWPGGGQPQQRPQRRGSDPRAQLGETEIA